ncbi:MAG: transcription antitermination factor NusB [Deltaproteobacteria bacterium]|nr:MAG: transcription antitermination factor NusB [Deltaproteobacteria bacterium]
MGKRRRSRELALQALFYMDMSKEASEEALERFCVNFNPPDSARPFFFKIITGVLKYLPQIDALIERFSKNWRIGRMSFVDRNVLRIAVYELLCCSDIPPKVTINEAIDIAKKFGTAESGAFINGIIDSIRLAHENGKIQAGFENHDSPVGL